jgi:Ca2+/Na+ antiporter
MDRVTKLYAAIFVGMGLVVFFLRSNKPTIISDISVAFFGSYLVCTFAYIRANMMNRKKRDTKMCQFTE